MFELTTILLRATFHHAVPPDCRSVPGVFASQQTHYLAVIKQMLLQALHHPQKEVRAVKLLHTYTHTTQRGREEGVCVRLHHPQKEVRAVKLLHTYTHAHHTEREGGGGMCASSPSSEGGACSQITSHIHTHTYTQNEKDRERERGREEGECVHVINWWRGSLLLCLRG